jgi:hypothetical protein
MDAAALPSQYSRKTTSYQPSRHAKADSLSTLPCSRPPLNALLGTKTVAYALPRGAPIMSRAF